ncbi:MFS transporter [Bauldia sp.]|uniref:MFS transporter n=1 Tax=Bauldia sp. TaxID=2575872 RepID=UPI003BAB2BC1
MANDNQKRWWLLGAMSGVLGLIVLDETIVSVSLPSITAELGLSASAGHWVVNAYLLSFTCAVAIAGRFGDLFSRRSYFSAGAALFALSSLLAALAPDGTMLIAARALQGIAAALIFPTSIALITAAFAPEKRGMAFGYQTTVGGIFMASGPLVGGLLTETVSWRLIFWIGIPFVIGIVVLLWLAWSPSYDAQREKTSGPRPRIEVMGPVFLIVALFGLVTTVMQGPAWGWLSPSTLGLLILGSVLLFLFLRTELTTPAPLLDLSLLKIPEFGGGVVIFAIFQFEKIVVFVFVAQFFQDVLGESPIMSGVAVSLAILPTFGTAILIGKSTDRFGSRYTLVRGTTIHGIAVLLLALATLQQNYLAALLPLLLWGASMPSIAIPVRRVQMNAVPKDKQGQASGINLTIQMLGGSLGLAVCSALLAETNSYLLLFLVVGVVTLLTVPIAQRSMAGSDPRHRSS